MFESKSGVFVIAGLGFFALAFLVMGLLPWTIYHDQPEKSLKTLAEEGMIPEFVELREKFPDQFKSYFGEPTYTSYAEALSLGHKVYVGEGCWHCHSQYIRPVSNEDLRWGPVSHAREYQNVLQRPVLFGTRRVGPDLIREASRKSNDWQLAHFYNPTIVVPSSVMPRYPWLFDDAGYPNKKGMALLTYVQWLGSWLKEYPYWQGEGPALAGDTEPRAAEPTAKTAAMNPGKALLASESAGRGAGGAP